MAALVGIAAMIAIPVTAYAGDRYAYENTQWQAPGAVIPVGHHYGWRNYTGYNSGLICDEDGDDCHPALQCDEDGDDCHYAWPDADDDYCEGGRYYGQRVPAYNRYRYDPPAYNDYGYNQRYGGAYNDPYDNNGIYGGLSTLAPLLQQFVR